MQLACCLWVTECAHVSGEVMGRALDVDVLFAEHLPSAGESIVI